CLSSEGKVLWTAELPHQTYYGPSSSPVLFEDLLIVPCHGTNVRYTVALDKRTGKTRWRTLRGTRNSEATPLAIRMGGADQIVCTVADEVVALDPRTGKELWSTKQPGYAQVPRPVSGHGLCFVGGGYFPSGFQALRPDGSVVWNRTKHVPQNPSPLLEGDELY